MGQGRGGLGTDPGAGGLVCVVADPLCQDLPLVAAGEWRTGIVTEEQIDATARNNVLVEMGREPEGEYDPIPWYSSPRWSKALMPIMPGLYNRWVCDIHVDDVICRMGRIQFDMTDWSGNHWLG